MYNANYTDTELAADLETALSDKEDVSVVFATPAIQAACSKPRTASPLALRGSVGKIPLAESRPTQSQGRSLTKAWKTI